MIEAELLHKLFSSLTVQDFNTIVMFMFLFAIIHVIVFRLVNELVDFLAGFFGIIGIIFFAFIIDFFTNHGGSQIKQKPEQK